MSEKVELILILSALFSILSSVVATSSKTGYIYGTKPALGKKPPLLVVDANKKAKFVAYCVVIAQTLFAGAWLLSKDVLLSGSVALFDTAFIGWALGCFVLLKEKTTEYKSSKPGTNEPWNYVPNPEK